MPYSTLFQLYHDDVIFFCWGN